VHVQKSVIHQHHLCTLSPHCNSGKLQRPTTKKTKMNDCVSQSPDHLTGCICVARVLQSVEGTTVRYPLEILTRHNAISG